MNSNWINRMSWGIIRLGVAGAVILISATSACAESSAQLIAAARAEGELTLIAIPRHWCNYGELIDGFKARYGIAINELKPDAGVGDVVETIRANKGNKDPQGPDVIEVDMAFATIAKAEGLLVPYKVATWNTIPTQAKDAEGYWYGDYYGVLSFEVNADLVDKVPTDWVDLQAPDYVNAVSLAGDARVSTQAILGVFAAGLSSGQGNISKASEAGLQYFTTLKKRSNFVPVIGTRATLVQGMTPIIVRWDYNALNDRDALRGHPKVQVVVPKTGVVAGVYAQAISAYAPHPNAARLWMEYLYSDHGQLTWLKGYCRPIRFNDLMAHHKVPTSLLAKLPPTYAYEKAVFPTVEQQNTLSKVITTQWSRVVGTSIQ